MKEAKSASPPSGYEPSYYTASTALDERYPVLEGLHNCETCVIGGGLAGLTITRELARKGHRFARELGEDTPEIWFRREITELEQTFELP